MSQNTANRFIDFGRTFVLAFGGLALITTGLTAAWSKSYWGYVFEPPELPEKIRDFDEILSITPFGTEFPDGGPSNYMASDDYVIWADRTLLAPSLPEQQNPYVDAEGIPYYDGGIKCDTESCSPSRVLADLSAQGLLKNVKPMLSQVQLTQVEQHLEQSQLLPPGKPGYEATAQERDGLVIEAMADGDRYLFLAIHGNQVSNDHHAYLEILFQQDSFASQPELIAINRLFHDVSGLEGLDFRTVLTTLLILNVLPSLGIALLYVGLRAPQRSTVIAS